MLIALFTILLLGGSATGMLDFIADSQDVVKVVMEKDDRRKEVLATLKETKKRTETHNKMVKGASKDMSAILSNDDVTDADIDTIWDAYFAQRAAYNQDMLDLRFQLKDQMTREEWQQVFAED
jgi:sugar-specific transcriptional regulator TrmB